MDFASPAEERIIMVDTHDTVIGELSRGEMRTFGGIYRVTYILIFNSQGDLLVQRRTSTKDQYPGLLDLAAGGVVASGEGYRESACRELKEELGVDAPLTHHGNVYFEDMNFFPENQNWGGVFSCICDGPFVLQTEEVADVKFMKIESILTMGAKEITPDTRQVLVSYLL
ncbi:MAG: NUDIX domain-containing protein [Gammaproteobacteria bacterium]|nr:NUDIX domain-containing protein [Gammaproteobacteria bacterium]